ncbi:uncharacterized protein LOC110098732 [Dendrobium catenatum]|uniref:uncharacterized protein LOC110098732 n=1 Tax=Dendrobium catenatum TaxID=906689 RepID=UPI00109F6A61|nr:uncharacterized protein LOC110098732 [Dendrobium catenatum]
MPYLPLKCWDEVNVERIASSIVKPLMMDGNMFQWGKREFSRICVRARMDQYLPPGTWVEIIAGKFYQRFEYEKISTLCYGCGMVGHLKHDCRLKAYGNSEEKPFTVKKQWVKRDGAHDDLIGKITPDNGNSDKVEDFVADTHLEEGEILDEVGNNSSGRDSKLVINSAEEIAGSSEEPSKIIGMFPAAINPVVPVCLNKFVVLDGVEEDGMEDACVKKVSSGSGSAGVNTVSGRPITAEGDKGCEGILFVGRLEKEAGSSGDLVKRKLAKELRALGPMKISSGGRCVDGGSKKKGLLETTISSMEKDLFVIMMELGWDYFILPSEGHSGGIMVLWKSDLASFSVLKTSDQCVIGDLNVFNKGVWMVSTVYASKETVKRRHLWEVVQESSNRDIPSIVGGDFNCILSQEDKKGGRRFKTNQGSLDMMKFMNENDYHEVGFVGPRYTWCNNKSGGGRILERLDRCILNTLALNKIQITVVKHLARVASDHCPIVLKMFEMSCKGRSVIKFEDTWLSFKTAEYIVSSRWKRPFLGDGMEVLNKKCKKTLKDLFYWSKARLKNFSLEKDKLKPEILVLQDEESKLGWQRAKAKWVKDGDANTKIFHSFTNARRNNNWISQVKDANGELSDDPGSIEEEFMRFFQVKWESRSCSFTGWPKPWTSLLNSDKEMQNRELNEAEISEVILNLGNNRAPGFDGISYSFFKAFWKIIRVDVVRAVQQKVEIMPSSEEQAAFVKGRSISNHLLLAQEVFNKLRFSKASNGFLAIKVDMEQAYDSMCWATLERMLIELGFPSRGNEVGIRMSTNAQKISHLLFADDILLIFEAKGNIMKKVRKILEDCCKWTGQNINYHKSSLVCGNLVDRRIRSQISRFMGIKLVDEFEYLGIKLALRHLRKAGFQCLLDKSCKKINAWGNRFVSFAGRMVLVKYVFLSLPIFTMTHSLIPMSTLLEFYKICRDFIWNKCDGKRGLHYLAWDHVCKPKEYGGWGVQSAVERRDAMRAKFSWKLIHNPDSLLSRQLNAKYGESWWNYRLYGRSSSTWKILFSRWNATRELVR